ncbi:MAG: isopentenyl-diphosphate Delta-isomerase [Candidatus Micrarchaeota archaeon]|nr:isopentenyl-diphosphate Delta-isomerase [Candidatus Micrarchaeota archaeon]
MEQKVILVDDRDNAVGLEGKMEAHRNGDLHRAVSVYIFDSSGRLMLQQRARGVYHSGLLWSNTCCTNCYEGESAQDSAHRSLRNEMGFDCELKEAYSITYRTQVSNGLMEHEFLHIFFGMHDGDPEPDGNEVMDWKWIGLDELEKDIVANSSTYTPWLKIILESGRLRKEADRFLGSG